MRAGTDNDKMAQIIAHYGKPKGYTTKYGSVVHFPDSKNGATFLLLADGKLKRVHGCEKRIWLSLLNAASAKAARPLPTVFMN